MTGRSGGIWVTRTANSLTLHVPLVQVFVGIRYPAGLFQLDVDRSWERAAWLPIPLDILEASAWDLGELPVLIQVVDGRPHVTQRYCKSRYAEYNSDHKR